MTLHKLAKMSKPRTKSTQTQLHTHYPVWLHSQYHYTVQLFTCHWYLFWKVYIHTNIYIGIQWNSIFHKLIHVYHRFAFQRLLKLPKVPNNAHHVHQNFMTSTFTYKWFRIASHTEFTDSRNLWKYSFAISLPPIIWNYAIYPEKLIGDQTTSLRCWMNTFKLLRNCLEI